MMTALEIDDVLAAKLNELAQTEGRPLQQVLERMLEQYRITPQISLEEQTAGINAISGMIEDDIQDASETVHNTVQF